MRLNPAFIVHVQDIYGEAGHIWLRDLVNRIQQLSALWGFRFLAPMPNLSYNFVGLVKMDATAKMAVLKMSPKEGNLATEIRWLNCIKKGVPEIYAFDEKLSAYLMERLAPGHSLKRLVRAGNDEGATKIICQMVRALQSTHGSDSGFRRLCELSKAFSLLEGKIDAVLLSKAQGLFRDLTTDRAGDVLLHGDLHHDNILASGFRWKAIDPHGYIGDPAAEVGAMVRNALDSFPNQEPLSKIVERRLQVMADELPFDPLKIKLWSFCMTVLSAAWSVEDHGKVPKLAVHIATAIDQAHV